MTPTNDYKPLQDGDRIKDSPAGAGKLTGFTNVGWPQVNGVAVTWVERVDGARFDPYHKRWPMNRDEMNVTTSKYVQRQETMEVTGSQGGKTLKSITNDPPMPVEPGDKILVAMSLAMHQHGFLSPESRMRVVYTAIREELCNSSKKSG